jgi:nitrilase
MAPFPSPSGRHGLRLVVFVIGCGIVERKSDIPDRLAFKQTYHQDIDEWINVGDSAIVNPEGEFIAGPLREQEGILYAEIDLVQMRAVGI